MIDNDQIAIWTVLGRVLIYNIFPEKRTTFLEHTFEVDGSISCSKTLHFLTPTSCIQAQRTHFITIHGEREVNFNFRGEPSITAITLVKNYKQIGLACEDGFIYLQDFEGKIKKRLKLQHSRTFPTALIHPFSYSDRYDRDLIISGCNNGFISIYDLKSDYAPDFTNRITCYSPEFTRLPVHMEAVQSFHLPPRNITRKMQESLLSISSDNSICIIDLVEKNVYMRCNHGNMPEKIYWREFEDFMIVHMENQGVKVWDVESQKVERNLDPGVDSEVIIASCPGKGYSCKENNWVQEGDFDGNLKVEKTINGYCFVMNWEEMLKVCCEVEMSERRCFIGLE